MSISTLMVVVLVVAVNVAAGDVYFGAVGDDWADLLNFGARPMASLLVIGAIPALRATLRRTSGPPFLVGFEAFGLAALLAFVAITGIFGHAIHQGLGNLLPRVVSPITPLFPWSITAILVLPQMTVALLGGRRIARGRFAA